MVSPVSRLGDGESIVAICLMGSRVCAKRGVACVRGGLWGVCDGRFEPVPRGGVRWTWLRGAHGQHERGCRRGRAGCIPTAGKGRD